MPSSPDHTRIYLTGFMGTGKSTVGPVLASRLGYGYLDLDTVIEEEAGRSVAAIFADEGEEGFRHRERLAVGSISAMHLVVVALGGGALVDPENGRRLRQTGILVRLDASPGEIAARLERAGGNRPLLRARTGARLHGAALAARIGRIMRERHQAYGQAHIVVSTDGVAALQVVDRIARALEAHAPDPALE